MVVGVCEEEAKQSLLPFVHQRSKGKPYVVIKAALSLDGRIACEDGTSQWITGQSSRFDGHRCMDALCFGSLRILNSSRYASPSDCGLVHRRSLLDPAQHSRTSPASTFEVFLALKTSNRFASCWTLQARRWMGRC